ncbi:MAG: 1,4-alpha-glucan branching protein domain-containing protein [Thermodesulfobacteriota bacterium]
MKKLGSFSLVLHSHLPYVLSHGTWPHGTDWLNEAAAETYLPLLDVFNRLKDEGMSPGVTVGLSPVLTEMLANDGFKEGFKGYLKQKIAAAEADIKEFTGLGDEQMAGVARMWRDFYGRRHTEFVERYNEDILGGFRELQDGGHIEIITCGATHGYFPLLSRDTSIYAQVKQAVVSYRRHFGRDPRGIWLPECAYRPSYRWSPPVGGEGEEQEPYLRKGVEEFLGENGLEYFFVDSHLLKGGESVGVYRDRLEGLKDLWERFMEQYEPLPEVSDRTPYNVYLVGAGPGVDMKPVAVFTRDPKTGMQVWSGEWGYPGDENYLEFHKKRFPGGHRYWRVTDAKADLADKQPYSPELAYGRVPEHAAHFVGLIKENLAAHREKTGKDGIVVSPYDAELFGHWWSEGPEWIYHVIKCLHADGEVASVTAGEYLDASRPTEVVSLPEGSWGEGGYHGIWLNETTTWTWHHIYEAEDEMHGLALKYGDRTDDPELQEILKQAAREFFLLVSSDWQFLISTRSASDYAEMRLLRHYKDFKRLSALASKKAGGGGAGLGKADSEFLALVSKRDCLFPDIDPMWFREPHAKEEAANL